MLRLTLAWPMITLMKWRNALRRNGDSWRPDERAASRIKTISFLEATLLLLIVLAATAMARGYGSR